MSIVVEVLAAVSILLLELVIVKATHRVFGEIKDAQPYIHGQLITKWPL